MPVWDGARGLVVEQLGLVDREGWYVRSRWLWCSAWIVLGAVFDLSGQATRNWVRGVAEVLAQCATVSVVLVRVMLVDRFVRLLHFDRSKLEKSKGLKSLTLPPSKIFTRHRHGHTEK